MKEMQIWEIGIKQLQNIFYGIIIVISIGIYGVFGSYFIMHLNFFDSIYYTIITMATVGYGDIVPITPLQKLFSISLALAGVGILAYVFSMILSTIADNIKYVTSGAKMNKRIAEMEDHYILCGYGRVGTVVLEELRKRNQKVILLEKNKELIEDFENTPNIIAIHGDATEDKTLKKINVKKSLGLILTTGNDVANLFIVLTTRELAPNAWIVSRASKVEDIPRLYHAGADKVISPEASGGNDIYFAAVEPNLIRITDKHDITCLKKELEIILKYKCTLENIEYHFPGIKSPLTRKIGILSEHTMKTFLDKIEYNENSKEAINTIYKSVNGIHSHWISGPDKTTLENVITELKKEGLVIGVNLTNEEILKIANETKEKKEDICPIDLE